VTEVIAIKTAESPHRQAMLDLLDDALLQLEEWQGGYQQIFPEYQQSFEFARDFLSKSLDNYLATLKRQPD